MKVTHEKLSKADKQEARRERREKSTLWLQTYRGSILFVALDFLFIAVIGISIALSILNRRYEWICWNTNSIGVLCQIVTTVVSFVASTMGIAITLQKEKCWGISIKEFNRLRSGLRYPIVLVIILSVIFSALNVGLYIANLMIASIGVAIVAIGFCIYIALCEIPLMLKSEKSLLKILKSRLLIEWKSPRDLPKELKTVLKCLITNHKTLHDTYHALKDKNPTFNKFLILKLLELQCDAASELKQMEPKQQRFQCADRLYENILSLICFNLDLSDILGDQFLNYENRITRVVFCLKEVEGYENKITSLIANSLPRLKCDEFAEDKVSKQKQQFRVSLVLSILNFSVQNGDFCFVQALQKDFSIRYRDLGQNNYESLVFALISMQFYFLCHDSQNASEELKSSIKEYLDYSTVIDHTKVFSWKNLYTHFAYEFKVDFKLFMQYFSLTESDWDIPIYFEVQWVKLDRGYAFRWYLIHVLNSFRVQGFEYSDLCVTDEYKFYLKDFGEKCFDADRKFIITDEMKSILNFYGVSKNLFSYFLSWKDFPMKFFNCINELKKKDLFVVSDRAVDKKNEEIASQYKETMLKAIREEWGYDTNIETTSSSKTLAVLIEKTSRAVNYEEAMGDALIRSVFHELGQNIVPKIILKNENFDGDIGMLLHERITSISRSVERIRYFIKDETIRKQFTELCTNAVPFDSSILEPYSLVKENGFHFNVNFDEFSVRNLTVDELSTEVEKYKSADGQYVYEGTFLAREEIERLMSQQYAVLKISMRYAIQTFEEAIIVVNLF